MKIHASKFSEVTYILRGALIVMVIFYHVSAYAMLRSDIAGTLLTSNGQIAVWGFFFLAGYTNALSFLRQKYDVSIHGILSFYFRRFARIIPLYWMIVIISYLLTPAVVPHGVDALLGLLLLYKPSEIPLMGHLWFVPTLAYCYLFAPLGALLLNTLKRTAKIFGFIVFIVLMGMGIVIRYLLIRTDPFLVVYLSFSSIIDVFLLGMVVAFFNDSKYIRFQKGKLLSVVLFGLLYLLGSYETYRQLFYQGPYYFVFAPLVTALVMSFIVSAYNNVSLKNIPMKLLGILGVLSYEIYLYHYGIVLWFSLHCITPCSTGEFFSKFGIVLVSASTLAGITAYVFSIFRKRPQRVSLKPV